MDNIDDEFAAFLKGDHMTPELSFERIDSMASRAVAYPQFKREYRKPANQNTPFIRKVLATAAAVLLMIGAGVELYPTNYLSTASSVSSNDDAYDEVTDLIFLETLNDLS